MSGGTFVRGGSAAAACMIVLFAAVSGAHADSQSAAVTIVQGAHVPGCGGGACYDPADVTIFAGGEITWSNADTIDPGHTVASGEPGAEDFGGHFFSGAVEPGGTYSVVLGEPGRYPYFCVIHPWMQGAVTVVGDGTEEIAPVESDESATGAGEESEAAGPAVGDNGTAAFRVIEATRDRVPEVERDDSTGGAATRNGGADGVGAGQDAGGPPAGDGAGQGPEVQPDDAGQGPEPSGGGCLIATAAYGSELAPQVQQLREIRDNAVMGTESGRAFMGAFNQVYYAFSPAIADMERESPVFREAVRVALMPMLATLSVLDHAGIDSEGEMLGAGIGIIALNLAIYMGIPAVAVLKLYQLGKRQSV
ncbi:copper binding protein, plastocyanin/azurin family [Cenarchaeum symbiosum A]|uniref:Copper binding protein, plastocyanin/azurin family n=1 Tax=Cenarchaeum symbiosum (strain A) TaxID=414004 RepID=A0RYI7_CENSY|nr:copper binding protein, plastocyanin/azurin family [Cenarchaeum symbiosum A]